MEVLRLLRFCLALSVLPPAASQPPGCRRQCGNVTVPYPFGIGAGCHHGAATGGFRLRCRRRPPRLTVYGYGHEVTAISLATAEATVLLNASRACYNDNHSGDPNLQQQQQPMALNGSAFLFSSMKSKFVSIGCPGLAYFNDGDGYYVTGCMSVCRTSERSLPGSCRGDDGCCQSNIPLGLGSYRPYLGSFGRRRGPGGGRGWEPQQATFMANSTACSYAFMVDAMWFWLAGSHFNRTGDFAVPVVLDWAIRDAPTCAAARQDTAAYACRSAQSVCLESGNGPGYVCNCTDGYQGNPYVLDGCTDVDECQHSDEFPCYGVCVNTPGSFTCTCPKGSSGNATIQYGCRRDNKFSTALKAVVAASSGVFLLLLAFFAAHLWVQKRRLLQAKRRFFEHNGGLLLQQQLGSLASSGVTFTIFSEEEIAKATEGFSEARVLGRGGHGVVYKGVLADGSAIAVKRSRVVDARNVKEFAREMLILSQINHRHVVKLLGCCLEVEVPMLVYEHVPNGSLHGHIHGGGAAAGELPAGARLRVAAEAADALAYMHTSASPPILHRDVKSANILLDGGLAAKVSDFGASRLAPAGEAAAVATLVQGTLGYLDPEYLLTSQLTSKSDVYSFAVVVLELLTGRKAFVPVEDEEGEEEGSLAFFFITAAQAGRHREVMDEKVREELGVEVVDEAAELLLRCLSMVGDKRPTMKEVADRLHRIRSRASSCRSNSADI
ncbi:hypothetical protein HU200_059624 [Digitaria exilis]|uniref:Uncharacterized protein n=1 Tax=Digitaria exilis TaxID=1010633 RepID=A0A835ABT9_9POAL|nr:hypothetical protein HU200_059624 [Digitaria exilis]CAB3459510.1 unnamed protein product [Digitaria exilis]